MAAHNLQRPVLRHRPIQGDRAVPVQVRTHDESVAFTIGIYSAQQDSQVVVTVFMQ